MYMDELTIQWKMDKRILLITAPFHQFKNAVAPPWFLSVKVSECPEVAPRNGIGKQSDATDLATESEITINLFFWIAVSP